MLPLSRCLVTIRISSCRVSVPTKYFAHDQGVQSSIHEPIPAGTPINLAGHSWVLKQLIKLPFSGKCKIANLITFDPVGIPSRSAKKRRELD